MADGGRRRKRVDDDGESLGLVGGILSHAVDIFCVVVIGAALWQIAGQQGLIPPRAARQDTPDPVAQRVVWDHQPIEVSAGAAATSLTIMDAIWSMFTVTDFYQDEYVANPAPVTGTVLKQTPVTERVPDGVYTTVFASQRETPPRRAGKSKAVPAVTQKHEGPIPKEPAATSASRENLMPPPEVDDERCLRTFFTTFDLNENHPAAPSQKDVISDTEHGVFQFLKTLKRAAMEGSKSASELFTRWVEDEVVATSDEGEQGKKGHTLLSSLLADQDDDYETLRTNDPVTPLLAALNHASSLGSGAATALLELFMTSIIADPREEEHHDSNGRVFADYFYSVAEASKQQTYDPSSILAPLGPFVDFVETSARAGCARAASVVEEVFNVFDADGAANSDGWRGTGNIFIDFFVELPYVSKAAGKQQQKEGKGSSSAADEFFEYLYRVAKQGSPTAADLLAQWVGAASSVTAGGSASKGMQFLASFLAPQEDSVDDDDEARLAEGERDGWPGKVWVDMKVPNEKKAGPSRFSKFVNGVLGARGSAAVPEVVSRVFTTGEEEVARVADGKWLISAKDMRQVRLLKERFRQIEGR
ncbi:hypothetical protein HK101_002046, partial [Irineochytrium annulatum]